MKLFRTFLALIFFTIFASPALAEEFDPIGDLYSNDALLNLDLSADFEMENSAFEESAIPVFELPPAETETLAAIPANDFEEIEIGSGGAIGDYSSEESPLIDLPTPRTDIPPIFFEDEENANISRFAFERRDTPTEISSFSYDSPATTDLSPTGPEAAIVITLLFAFPAAWIFKRKFLNV